MGTSQRTKLTKCLASKPKAFTFDCLWHLHRVMFRPGPWPLISPSSLKIIWTNNMQSILFLSVLLTMFLWNTLTNFPHFSHFQSGTEKPGLESTIAFWEGCTGILHDPCPLNTEIKKPTGIESPFLQSPAWQRPGNPKIQQDVILNPKSWPRACLPLLWLSVSVEIRSRHTLMTPLLLAEMVWAGERQFHCHHRGIGLWTYLGSLKYICKGFGLGLKLGDEWKKESTTMFVQICKIVSNNILLSDKQWASRIK